MLKKILVVGALSLLFLGMVYGQSDTEKRALAKMYCEEAEKKYGEGDCIGAREAIVVSRGYYEEIGDAGGMNSCDLLIGQINPCLAAKGEEIYVNAKDLFNTGQTYMGQGSYDLAKQNFLKANTTVMEARIYFSYRIPPYTHKVEACDNLSSLIAENLITIIRQEAGRYLKEAHDIYSAGLDNYGVNYLMDSRENAQKAYEIYKTCNDSEGTYSSGKLVEKIEENLLDLKELARQLYDGGKEAYDAGGYDNYRVAFNNFRKCSTYYQAVGETMEKKQCDDMGAAALKALSGFIAEMEAEAKDKYIKAGYSRNYGDWDSCISGASEARGLYYGLYDLKFAEKDFNEAHRYETEAIKCNTLKKECQVGKDKEEQIKVANELYQKAQEAYNSGEYEDALSYNEQAFNIFVEVNDPTGRTKCEMFKPRIDAKIARLNEGNNHYNAAKAYYDNADFDNATISLGVAVSIYQEINRYTGNFGEYHNCVGLNASILHAVGRNAEADHQLKTARDLHSINEYAKARIHAENAKSIYNEINYKRGVMETQEFIDGIKEPSRPFVFAIVLSVAISMVLITIKWTIDKRKTERKFIKELTEKKRREEESRRLEEEGAKAKEGRRRELIDEERKQMWEAIKGER
ncbi:MAG: hypothetical protein KAU03_01300 [Candidatus Altiarchaeales archaeon]|nr:hypothetical protein [Candidatus Altiarchaeales archaeon]